MSMSFRKDTEMIGMSNTSKLLLKAVRPNNPTTMIGLNLRYETKLLALRNWPLGGLAIGIFIPWIKPVGYFTVIKLLKPC